MHEDPEGSQFNMPVIIIKVVFYCTRLVTTNYADLFTVKVPQIAKNTGCRIALKFVKKYLRTQLCSVLRIADCCSCQNL